MKISNRDWTQISAYLDGELNQREMDQLRRRIEVDPDFQAALEELKATRDILRRTPEIPVPRNFTLSPAQVGLKTRRPVYKDFRLAAALMSFLLVGVLILDFGRIFMGGASAPAMAPLAEEIMMEKAVEDALDVPVEEPALLAAEVEGDSTRSTADEEAAPEIEEVFTEEAAAPGAEPEEGLVEAESAPPAESEVQAVEEAEAPAAEEEVQAFEEEAAPAGTQVGEAKTAGEEAHDGDLRAEESDAVDQANLAAPTATPLPSPYPTQPPVYYEEPVSWEAPRRLLNPFRVLEIIFFVGVLGFGITARVLRKRDQR